MQKLFAVLMAIMMFTSAAYAKGSSAQTPEESFSKLTQGITAEIEKSYQNGDTTVVQIYDPEENPRGWTRYRYDHLSHNAKIIEPKAPGENYKAALEMSFIMYELDIKDHPEYFKTRQEAASAAYTAADWRWADDLPLYFLFTYELCNGKWQLISSQYGYKSTIVPDSGYDKVTEEKDRHMQYTDFSNHKLYKPLNVFLVKNFKKSPWF